MTTPKIKSQVRNKYDKRCAYCGEELSLKEMTIDHIHPSSIGGSSDIDNLNPCCSICNEFKKDLSVEEFKTEIEQQLRKTISKKWFNLLYKFNLINIGNGNLPITFHFEKYLEDKE